MYNWDKYLYTTIIVGINHVIESRLVTLITYPYLLKKKKMSSNIALFHTTHYVNNDFWRFDEKKIEKLSKVLYIYVYI